MAIREENFDVAKQVKETIDRLYAIGKELSDLEAMKRQAVDSEDFDKAKQIKMRIQQLRTNAEMPSQGQLGAPQRP